MDSKRKKTCLGVEAMKIVLEKEMVKLEVATRDTEKMLSGLQISSMEAKKEADSVDKIKKKCEADATRIAGEKALCEEDLAKAQPFVDEANDAIKSIKPGDIQEVKVLKKPLYNLNMENNISEKYKSQQAYYADCVRKYKVPD